MIRKSLSIALVAAILSLQPAMVYAEDSVTEQSETSGDAEVINEEAPSNEVVQERWVGTVKLTSGTLNVRKGPSLNDEIIGSLQNGTKIEVLEQFEEWVKIPFEGSTAYVSKPYLIIVKEQVTKVSAQQKVIVLDPGHGGKDPGAIASDGTYESETIWPYAVKAKEALEHAGYIVFLTRGEKSSCTPYKKIDEELTCRSEFAEKVGGDLFISIHADSNPSKKFRGTVTYYNETRYTDGLRNPFPEESKNLAKLVHAQVQPIMGSTDRGVQNKHYFVNRKNTVPSVLIELGVLTNTSDRKLLKDKKKPDQFASSLTRAIVNYFEQH